MPTLYLVDEAKVEFAAAKSQANDAFNGEAVTQFKRLQSGKNPAPRACPRRGWIEGIYIDLQSESYALLYSELEAPNGLILYGLVFTLCQGDTCPADAYELAEYRLLEISV